MKTDYKQMYDDLWSKYICASTSLSSERGLLKMHERWLDEASKEGSRQRTIYYKNLEELEEKYAAAVRRNIELMNQLVNK